MSVFLSFGSLVWLAGARRSATSGVARPTRVRVLGLCTERPCSPPARLLLPFVSVPFMPLPSHRDYTLGGRVFCGMPSGPSTLPRQPPADDPCAWITRRRRAMDDGEGTLSIALLSGTDDKLSAAALLTAGAAALGRKVDILLQYWALDSFRAGTPTKDHGLAPEAGPAGGRRRGRHGLHARRRRPAGLHLSEEGLQ